MLLVHVLAMLSLIYRKNISKTKVQTTYSYFVVFNLANTDEFTV